jgi:hypothetical protein
VSSALFFAVSGVMEVYLFFLSEFRHLPILVLGLLSIIEAYFLIRKENWSIRLIPAIFIVGVTFGITTIYGFIIQQTIPVSNILLLVGVLLAYLVLLTILSAYLLMKRRGLQS